MKKLALLSIFLCGVLALTACSTKNSSNSDSSNNSNSSNSQSGENKTVTAYNFSAMDSEGKTITLNDYKGKKVYINMWASWCKPCLNEIPELEKTYQKLKDRKDFIFLSMTSPKDEIFKNQNPADKDKVTILEKANELGITYPILFDVNDRFITNYNIRSFPTHIFINSDGTIAKKIVGMISTENLEKEIDNLK
ncbi:TlpA family protein disulfide reductase [Gemella cuniculi]|uniref:TlpA family protein disulfide reductase n=1 Tax=Gemella cuniculi TaxID=150240 RepID=UPI00041BF307|nr:TlpA disulfide reductase family protein [Gemella cuniculi]